MFWRTTAPSRRPVGFIEPCIPTRAYKPPAGPQWLHEIKHDGYRLIVCRRGDRVRLFTRRGYDWTDRYPLIVAAADALPCNATIDGEVVVCDRAGVADFERLHSREHDRQAFLWAFDLLELDGEDLRPSPLFERKGALRRLLRRAKAGIHFVDHLEGDRHLLARGRRQRLGGEPLAAGGGHQIALVRAAVVVEHGLDPLLPL